MDVSTYRVWLKRGCLARVAVVRWSGAPDDLARAVDEQVDGGPWELQVAEPLRNRSARGDE